MIDPPLDRVFDSDGWVLEGEGNNCMAENGAEDIRFLTRKIGTEEQWQEIFARNPNLLETINALIDLTAHDHTPVKLENLAQEIIFALSRVCIEECWEILLLAANQYGNGALRNCSAACMNAR